MNVVSLFSTWLNSAIFSGAAAIQESGTTSEGAENQIDSAASVATDSASTAEKLKDSAQDIASTLNESDAVQNVSAGILEPIYNLAEFMELPAFYWVAFALMVAGVVSFAAQLLLSKFFLLFKLSLNFKEILGDLLGLLISLVGLVLTTQAAAQNSTFPESAIAVVSAAVVGAIVGFVFYLWGQQQEFSAARRIPKQQQPVQSR